MGLFSNLFGGSKPKVDIGELVEQGAAIIDVRTPSEFATGHIQVSKNYPLHTLSSHVEEIKKMPQPIVLVCRSGTRAGFARKILRKVGIESVNAGAWQNIQ